MNPVYIFLGVFLFAWLSIPRPVADTMRGVTVAACAPSFDFARGIKKYLADRPTFWKKKHPSDDLYARRLELENAMLRDSLEKVSTWILRSQEDPFIEQKAKYFINKLQLERIAVPATVVYRDPSSWSSSLWVNVGTETNEALGREIIVKNSPVLSGAAVVGVVDYVGKKQSRIQLITDGNLCPSVRATRDGAMLAKGEVHGSGGPLWRSRTSSLKGIGFNYDFPDLEGEAPVGVDIIQEGDLLITTGFDGVFPPNLVVGTVSHVDKNSKVNPTYSIDIQPAATDLNDLNTVYVLPPRT